MVWGIASSETPDSEDEIADFDGTSKAFTSWAEDSIAKTADGAEPSLGNIRVMHQLQVGGKATKIELKSAAKQIWLGSTPANDEVWALLKGGFLKGYSIGGSYAPGSKKKEGDFTRYTPIISEVSYVDLPANPDASFQYIKADGSMELRKFASADESRLKLEELKKQIPVPPADDVDKGKKRITAVIGHLQGETTTTVQTVIFSPKSEWTEADAKAWLKDHDLKAPKVDETGDSFRFRQRDPGDFQEGSFRTIPFKGSKKKEGAMKIENRIREAYAAKKITKGQIAKAAELLEEHGVPTSEGVRKGLYTVGRMADVLDCLASLHCGLVYESDYEGDESPIPDDLADVIRSLQEVFLALAEEESSELVAMLNKSAAPAAKEEGEKIMDEKTLKAAIEEGLAKHRTVLQGVLGMLKAVYKGLGGHFKKGAAHHEKMAAHHAKAAGHHADLSKAHADHAATLGKGHESHAFHKEAAAHHGKLEKAHLGKEAAHKAHAAHLMKMADMHDEAAEGEGDKAAAALASLLKADFSGAPGPEEKMAAQPAAGLVVASADDLAKNLNQQIAALVKSSAEAAIEEIKNSPEFRKSISDAAIAQMKTALGEQVEPAKLSLVPRRGDDGVQKVNGVATAAASGGADMTDTGL